MSAAKAAKAAEVRAAGVVPWRRGTDGLEILLIHRPRYDDWSFPKGKHEGDEGDEACAVREFEEETGQRGKLGRELGPSEYRDARGRRKVVRYWTVEVRKERSFEPNREVDKVRWLRPERARRKLTYDRDVDVLDDFVRWARKADLLDA